jgi:hypothetical protein
MLRRQAIRPLRKPLVVMSPKSLLRHKEAVSTLEEMASGRFYNVLDETDDIDPAGVQRIILCSGKVFYDLRAARRERGIDNIAIIRLEQLYPFPEAELLSGPAALPGDQGCGLVPGRADEPGRLVLEPAPHAPRPVPAQTRGVPRLRRPRGLGGARCRLHGPAPGEQLEQFTSHALDLDSRPL